MAACRFDRRPLLMAVLVIVTAWQGMAAPVQVLHDGTFRDRISDGAWLVVFSSSWCATCKALAPIIDQVAADPRLAQIGVTIGKVDVQIDPTTAKEEDIDYIPTIIFYNRKQSVRNRYQGSVLDRLVNGGGSAAESEAVAGALIDFVQDQYRRPSSTSPESSPRGGSKTAAPTAFLSQLRVIAQRIATQNLAVFTIITYALGLTQGLFFGVMYRVHGA